MVRRAEHLGSEEGGSETPCLLTLQGGWVSRRVLPAFHFQTRRKRGAQAPEAAIREYPPLSLDVQISLRILVCLRGQLFHQLAPQDLPIPISVCLCVSLSVSVSLFVSLSLSLFLSLFLCLSVSVSPCLSLSVSLFPYLSPCISLPVSLCVPTSVPCEGPELDQSL